MEKSTTHNIESNPIITQESLEIIKHELVNAMCDDDIKSEYRIKLKTAYEEISNLRE